MSETFEELAEQYPRIVWNGQRPVACFVFDHQQNKIDELEKQLKLCLDGCRELLRQKDKEIDKTQNNANATFLKLSLENKKLEEFAKDCFNMNERWYDTVKDLCDSIDDTSYEAYLEELNEIEEKHQELINKLKGE